MGKVLYKKKIFFKQQPTDQLLIAIESLAKEERILKHSPRFAVVTDYNLFLRHRAFRVSF